MTENAIPELFFKNPLNLPVEKLYLKIRKVNGGTDEVKAIDKFWVAQRFYPSYAPLPEEDDSAAQEKWLERAQNYISSLEYILNLPFYKFWSNILYDPAIPLMLDSFLQNAVPCYLPQPTEPYLEPYSQIYDLVFSIYCKIFTPRLSQTEFMTPKTLGKLVRDENVITNHTLWDISKLYGHTDDGTLKSVLGFAYGNIPELKDELVLVITCMSEIFEAIGTAAYEEESPTEKIVTKLTILLYDTAFAVNMFMKMYPPFKDICINENLFSRMIHTYDSEVPLLYHLMKSVFLNDDNVGYERVDNARVEMLETCHSLMSHSMDMILQNSHNPNEQNKWTETYLSLVNMVIKQNQFLTDFDRVFPISQDIEMLQAICPHIDPERCNSILSAVVKHQVEEEELESKEAAKEEESGLQDEAAALDESTVPEHIILESKITELLDVFPDLGDGFLEQCLINMNMDSQAVIMAILEDSLPSSVANLDRTLPRIPPELPEAGPSLEAVYIGKKPSQHKDLNDLLNDKTHVNEQKEQLLRNYSVTTSVEEALYDDDFDDRYDDDFTTGIDSVDIEEIRQPNRRGRKSESESEEEEEEPKVEETRPKNAFCEDPAVIRARREAQYQQNRRGGKGPPQNKKSKDVVGKAKGQGQEKDVQHNRDKKNVQKSSRANHNRRQGAQFKRSRGMIPS